MSGSFPLDWASMAASLFNTVILTWLGLAVLLNAERHTAGIWIAGGELLMGGLFFLSHSIILAQGFSIFDQGQNFWWHLGWFPVVTLPYAWYGVVLWYAGYWNNPKTSLHRRHKHWFWLTSAVAVTIVSMLFLANPLPSFSQVALLELSATPSIGSIPLLILVYPLYIFLCIALALDVLFRPAPSGRLMGDLARRRARPWLTAASLVQIIVSLLVGWVMVWVISYANQRVFDPSLALTVSWFDLVIASLIAIAVLLIGQAIVSYEVFTGKSLPRRGLRYYWRGAILLASGFAIMTGWALTAEIEPIYNILLSTLLVTVFYALLSWRSYVDREQYVEQLRPFVSSQNFYDRLVSTAGTQPPEAYAAAAFQAICSELLEARSAHLIPVGPLAPLIGSALSYPANLEIELPATNELLSQIETPQELCIPLAPEHFAGAAWAIPLWSARGLVGVLLLGEKQAGGLYTREEMETARAAGERLVDTLASAEIARRLMTLQRQRLAQSQVLDHQTRRILHDDILPQLHAAMLTVNSQPDPGQLRQEALEALADTHRQLANLLQELPRPTIAEIARQGIKGALEQVIQGELKGAFERVTWQVDPEAERQAIQMPAWKLEVIYYAAREALRNAARHAGAANPTLPLTLQLEFDWHAGLRISIQDNGSGLPDSAAHERGHGLALHSTLMAVAGGTLTLNSTAGQSTRVELWLPEEKYPDLTRA
jgi:signal transduction histidine kinase